MKKLFTLCFALCLALGLSAQVVLSEDFSLVTDSTSSSIANSINTYTQTTGWTADWVYPCTGKVKLGKSSAGGFIQTPALDLSANNGQFVVSFDAEAWYNDNTHIKIIIDGVEYTGGENKWGSYFMVPYNTFIKANDVNQMMKRTTATDLIVEDGKITGVKAVRFDGTEDGCRRQERQNRGAELT